VPNVPVQLTFEDLAASAARFHPAASAVYRQPANRTGAATVQGDGERHRVALDATLLASGVRSGDQVTVKDLAFAPIRVVFVAADPSGSGLPSVSQESERIRREARLGDIKLVGEFRHATVDTMDEIMALKPDIIHLACHGADGTLFLEDDIGHPFMVSAQTLADRLARTIRGQRIGGIFLSRCSGETIAPPLLTVAHTVVADREAISESAAASFTENFYAELPRISDIAVAAARAAQRSGTADDLIVLPHSAGIE